MLKLNSINTSQADITRFMKFASAVSVEEERSWKKGFKSWG